MEEGGIIDMCKYVTSFQCIQQFSWLAIIDLLFVNMVNKKGLQEWPMGWFQSYERRERKFCLPTKLHTHPLGPELRAYLMPFCG